MAGEAELGRENMRITILSIALTAAFGLTGCGVADSLGLGKKRSPDEFSVVKRAPLVLPPNYSLRPPRPGAPRPQETAPKETARSALLNSAGADSSSSTTADVSPGESALMREANTDQANPDIRDIIDRETTALAAKSETFTDRLIFWQEDQPPGEIVDPNKEASRIQENQATGQPITTGTTPVIKYRQRGLLEGIF